MKTYQAGIDVGSTTVKLVVLDENGQMLFGQYQRHLSHTQLLLLKLLSTEDMYGYQIILELARRSSNVFEMKEGTLYPVLHGMEREGYVEAYEKAAPTGRMRKYYHLTRAGRAALTEEEKAWQEYSGAVNAVLHFA